MQHGGKEVSVYEFYYCIASRKFVVYHMDIDSETNKMLYGRAVRLGNAKNISRFAIKKDDLNVVVPKGDFTLRVRTCGESLGIATRKALTLIASFMQDEINCILKMEVNND